MSTIAHKSARKIVGYVILAVLLVAIPRMQDLINIIEAHRWIGITLILCAICYVVWGMFWDK